MKNELEIKHTGNGQELTIREGAALPLKEAIVLTILATITGIFLWLEKRVSEVTQKACHILVEKEKLKMTLIINELNYYRTTIISKLTFSKEYIEFGINNEKQWECFALADFIKMHRSFFQDKVIAGEVVVQLRDFKAKVNNIIEKSKDERANKSLFLKQTVESNLPPELKVKIPIFKGEAAVELTLEIWIDPDDFGCTFICPEATDYIHEQTEAIIEGQLDKIRELAPEIAIIYA